MSHTCPAAGCTKTIPSHMVACKAHWFKVPKELRDQIWATYRTKPGGPAHREAVFEAVRLLRGES